MVVFDALVAGHVRRHALRAFVSVLAVALGVAAYLALRLANAHAVAGFAAQTGVFGDEADFTVERVPGTLDESLLRRIRAATGVASATPSIVGLAIVPAHRTAAPSANDVLRIEGRDLLAPLPRAYEFRSELPGPFAPVGSGPSPEVLLQRRGVIVTSQFAKRHGLHVGGILFARIGTARTALRVAAIAAPEAELDENVALVDISTAQDLFSREGALDRIDLNAAPGAAERARSAVAALLPPGARIVAAAERRMEIERMLAGFTFNVTAIGLFALLVAAVLAYDAISISVFTRRIEVGTLRTLGASRGAIVRAFAIEGALLGALGGLFGTLAGTLIAGMAGAFARGSDALAFDPLAPLEAFAIGVVLGMLGAFVPALQAAALRPVRALASRPLVSSASPTRAASLVRTRAARFVDAVTSTRYPALWLGLANLRAAPRRLFVSLAALAVGVSLATTGVTFATSFRASIVAWSATAFRGDVVARPFEGAHAARAARFTPAAVATVAATPGVASVEATRTLTVSYAGSPVSVTSVVGPSAPVPRSSAGDSLATTIDTTFAARSGLRAGDTFALPSLSGTIRARVVRVVDGGAFEPGTIAVARTDFVRAFRDDTADTLTIVARRGADLASLRARLQRALAPRALDVRDTRELRNELLAHFQPIVAATFALAALAFAMGGLGIVTALFALVLERRDDIRLVRFVGLSRGGVRATVVCEAALLGALAGVAGVTLGLASCTALLAIDRAGFGWAMHPVVPFGLLAAAFLASVVVAVCA
ncbi:MAG: ABC transporter permease, partial [Candidatus Eremiobacteraeota bacterium]|nr:ABC transporter permease [Candidatus Eremiobacteraeota bacterium]